MLEGMSTKTRVIVAVVVIGVCVVVCLVSNAATGAVKSELNGIISQTAETQAQIDVINSETQNKNRTVVEEASGMSFSRVSADTRIIQSFMKTACSWNSKAEYDKVRSTIMNEYGLTEDNSFMQTFLAPVADDVTSEGETAGNIIDNKGLNMQCTSVDAYVTGFDETTDVYSYLAEVHVTTTVSSSSSELVVVLTCTIDSNGKMSDIQAASLQS